MFGFTLLCNNLEAHSLSHFNTATVKRRKILTKVQPRIWQSPIHLRCKHTLNREKHEQQGEKKGKPFDRLSFYRTPASHLLELSGKCNV